MPNTITNVSNFVVYIHGFTSVIGLGEMIGGKGLHIGILNWMSRGLKLSSKTITSLDGVITSLDEYSEICSLDE